jgi:hypothetical protein
MEFALINFRVAPQDRRRLRVALLQRGQTLQGYFASVVERELDNVRAELVSVAGEGDDGDHEQGEVR